MSYCNKFTNMDYEQLKLKHADYFKTYTGSPVSIASKLNERLLLFSENDNVNFIYGSIKIHEELGNVLLSKYRDGDISSKEEINDGSILFWAIYNGKDFDFIKSILKKGVDVNKITYDPKNNYRSTPLFKAIHERQFDIVELLLITGEIDINLKPHGETVLIFTLKILFDNCMYVEEYHNIIKLLLQNADINVHEETREGESALDLTIKNEMAEREINREIFKSLTSHKNFKYEKIKDKAFPLLMAIKSDSFDFFQFLITSQKINLNENAKLVVEEIIELYPPDTRYLELFLQSHSDKINEDAFIHAVWYDNEEALKFLFENANWTLSNTHTTNLQSMEITALLCMNGAKSGRVLPVLPWEMKQIIFNFFPACKSETYTFDFNSSFFLKFHQNLFTDFLSIAAALCKTDMVKIILDHVLKKKCLFSRGLLSISHNLKDMKAFQDKEIREAKETLSKLLTPESYEKVQKAAIFLEKLYNFPIETQKTYEDREEKFNAIMKMIEEVKEKLSHCGLAI